MGVTTAVVNASNTDNQFYVTDISDLSNITSSLWLAPFNTGENNTQGCVVDCYGRLAAVGSYQTGSVAIYDLTNPAQPSQQCLFDTGFGGIGAISINGTKLLVGEATGPQIALIDVSNPKNPATLSSQAFSGLGDQSTPGLTGVALVGSVAIATDCFSIVVLDYSNLSTPQQLPYLNYEINFHGPMVCAFDGFTAAVGTAAYGFTSGSVYLFSVPNGVLGGITLQNQFEAGIENVTSVAMQGNVVAACSSSSTTAIVAYMAPEISSPIVSTQVQIGSGGNPDPGGAVKFYGLPANLATSGISQADGYPPPPSFNAVTCFSISNQPQFSANQIGINNTSSPPLNQGLVYTLGVASFETFQIPWWKWIWRIILAPFRLLFG